MIGHTNILFGIDYWLKNYLAQSTLVWCCAFRSALSWVRIENMNKKGSLGSETMKHRSEAFLFGDRTPRESVGEGMTRQLFGYDDAILMARVEFDVGAVGQIHAHPHSQVSYVESGEFDVHIDGITKRLCAGDSFYIRPNVDHGAVCRKAGVLLDVFSPVREDFLDENGK